MNLNSNNEKFIQTSKDDNFKAYNATICNDEHFKSSQRNLIMIYIFLYDFVINNNLTDLNTFLNNTTYFNKIIFLKYLNFFRNLNKLQQRMLDEKNRSILTLKQVINTLQQEIDTLSKETETLQQEIDTLYTENDTLEESEEYEKNISTIDNNASIIEEKEETIEETFKTIEENKENIEENKDTIKIIEGQKSKLETKFEHIKDEFIVNTTDILKDNLNVDYSIITTLFDAKIIDKIYNAVITHINDNPHSFEEYLTLFHLNNKPINNSSSNKAIFYIGVHGTFCIVVPNNTYLTIASPVNTTINRWGERGDPLKYFNTMDYTFKQCLLQYNEENLTNDMADTCFDLLGTSKTEYNLNTRQTTPAYCEKEPDNYFSNLTDFKQNEKMRIKHYTADSFSFMIFNTDYTIPDALFDNLSFKIPELNNMPYNTAENIINLNFLLFTNNINFTIFNLLNIANKKVFNNKKVSTFGLYSDIGLYTRYYLEEGNTELQSDLHNFSFPLDIFSFDPNLFTADFTLDREIYALNNINIHLKYQDVDRSFVLLKGDSFSCNPYIIEYFIKTFNSKITIRPGPILGNKEDEIFKENRKNDTTRGRGATITCLTKGLSCYKVTLSVLTNYEILQFCKDANINTCDLYDTSCQSFAYVNDVGEIIDNYTPLTQQKQTLKRMNTIDDTKMLEKYDNLSDILFAMDPDLELARDFLVVGNVKPNETPNETPDLKRQKIEGGTQKYINRKKNSRKRRQTKNIYKRTQRKNSRKQTNKKKKTKKIYK